MPNPPKRPSYGAGTSAILFPRAAGLPEDFSRTWPHGLNPEPGSGPARADQDGRAGQPRRTGLPPVIQDGIDRARDGFDRVKGDAIGAVTDLGGLMVDRLADYQGGADALSRLQRIRQRPSPPATAQPAPPAAMSGDLRRLAQILGIGEGNYESYNTGTRGVPGGRVGHSYLNPAPGTVTGKTINQVLATDPFSGSDPNRMFAVGAYQITIPTLRAAVRDLKLTGEERLTPQLQDRIFADFLVRKAGGGRLADFISHGIGTVDDAQYAAAKEWASVAVPVGFKTDKGRNVSDGAMSYYGGPANRANLRATQALRAFLANRSRQGKK